MNPSDNVRQADQAQVEAIYGWTAMGNPTTRFTLKTGTLFAIGYERIVYGDHGPYVEYSTTNIIVALLKKFPDPQAPGIYYVWHYPVDHPKVKVYYQLRTVANLPNAPQRQDGKPHAFNRAEGYADYRIGFYYVSPYVFLAPGLFDL